MKNSTIYIGGGIRPHLILSLLPIIDGFCKKQNIQTIIFERDVNTLLKSNILYKNLKSKYIIKNLEQLGLNKIYFIKYIFTGIFFLSFYLLSFFFKKKYLLSKKISWIPKQILHSYWDAGIINNKYELDRIELKSRVISCIQISRKFLDFLILKSNGINYAYLGHLVYSERFLFALLRYINVKTYRFNGSILIKQDKNSDRDSKYLDKKIYRKSLKMIPKERIDKYWKNLKKGSSKNEEVNFAAKIKSKKKKYNSININVIMLHIFKDSSFDDIDTKRIFPDYYTWVVETLKIIKESKEIWILRKHPSADRWGENQKKIIKNLLKDIFGKQKPNNIFFEENSRSNMEQFKISKRIVTYSGSSHLEATCLGIKPIVISDVGLMKFDKNLVFKPKNYKEYRKLLLSYNKSHFSLTKKQAILPKRIIFLLQNVVNFSEDTGCTHIFRNDPEHIFKQVFNRIKKKIKTNYDFLYDLGYNIDLNYQQGINKKYFYRFINEEN